MIIDEQFRTLIPPLTADEYARLEGNILKEGIRDKLVVWNDTLIDGHNRFRIATENDLLYETVEMQFDSREHALNWIISNQLGRRNLNPNQIAYLRGKRYENEKKIVTNEKGVNQHTKEVTCTNDMQPKSMEEKRNPTASRIANDYGVGIRSVIDNGHFSRVVDILPEEAKSGVLSGEEKISRTNVKTILSLDSPTQKKFLQEVESGTPIKEAVKKVDPEQKRKEKDEKIRREIEREREFREKAKFSPHIRRFNDITVSTKQQLLDNISLIPEDVEIWVIYKKETSEEAKLTLNTHTKLQIS